MPFISVSPELASSLAYGSRSDFVAAQIREFIMLGILVPDESIRIDEVAEQYGVSATPVREALQSLVSEGFLYRVTGSGYRVIPMSAADIEDIFLAHSFIAGELAARAVPAVTEETLKELRAIHYDTLAVIERGQFDQLNVVNREFHQIVNHTSDSPKLRWLTTFYLKYMPQRLYGTIKGWPEITTLGQTRLLEALGNGDADEARTAAAENVVLAGRSLASHFAQTVVRGPDPTLDSDPTADA